MKNFTPLDIRPDIEQSPWQIGEAMEGQLASIGMLRHGTTGGRASVALLVHLPDGTHVVVQTTWRLFTAAHRALAASPIAAEEV